MEQNGYSVIEVSVCCVVLAVMSAISYPNLREMYNSVRLRGEVRRLHDNLQRAKLEAFKHNGCAVFQFFHEGYAIFMDDGARGGVRGDWVQQKGEQGLALHTFPADIRLTKTTYPHNRGRFRPIPGVWGGSVILRNQTGKQVKILINSMGRIRIKNVN